MHDVFVIRKGLECTPSVSSLAYRICIILIAN